MTTPLGATAPQTPNPPAAPAGLLTRLAQHAMVLALGLMALAVFVNVVLRYGFGSGIAASEELSRLLFVWLVFIGAAVSYPKGEHMAFTSALLLLRGQPTALAAVTVLIRLLVLAACVALGAGAWQQVVVGLDSKSVVLGYPTALLPLPALLCALAIGGCALTELLRRTPLDLGHQAEVE